MHVVNYHYWQSTWLQMSTLTKPPHANFLQWCWHQQAELAYRRHSKIPVNDYLSKGASMTHKIHSVVPLWAMQRNDLLLCSNSSFSLIEMKKPNITNKTWHLKQKHQHKPQSFQTAQGYRKNLDDRMIPPPHTVFCHQPPHIEPLSARNHCCLGNLWITATTMFPISLFSPGRARVGTEEWEADSGTLKRFCISNEVQTCGCMVISSFVGKWKSAPRF